MSDVHLGLDSNDPEGREKRFLEFLKGIPRDSGALFLLGDIWDFWYEYKDVVPKEGMRVVAQLIDLMDSGVEVYFFPGNHDIWTYRFFEEIGIRKPSQPYFTEIGGKNFCLAHGDLVGNTRKGYSFMMRLFHNKAVQFIFSLLHPYLAFRLGNGWSGRNRKRHGKFEYVPEKEGSYRFAVEVSEKRKIDFFVFGHFHRKVDVTIPGSGSRFVILGDWIRGGSPYAVFDGEQLEIYD